MKHSWWMQNSISSEMDSGNVDIIHWSEVSFSIRELRWIVIQWQPISIWKSLGNPTLSVQELQARCLDTLKGGCECSAWIRTENLYAKAITKLRNETYTFQKIHTEVVRMDPLYRKGYSLVLKQPKEGHSDIYKWNDQTVIIPSRYDHRSGGGWWVDYVYATLSHRQKQHMKIWTAVTARLGISPLSVCGSSTADAAL